MTTRHWLVLATTVVVAAFVSCVDGRSPTGLEHAGTASLSVIPVFGSGPQPAEGAAAVNRIRITARLEKDGTVLATFVVDVDPTASEWDVQFDIPIPAGGGSVVLTIELVNALPGGGEVVQWSGQSPAVPLVPGQPTQVQEVQVYRGPVDNLAVTGVTVTPDSSRIVEGDSVQLRAAVSSTSPQANPSVFWTSLDTAVASVSSTGMVRGRLPGTARIVVQSGRPADTARVVVAAIPRAVTISPASVTLTAAGQEATFSAQVVDARGAPIAGQQVSWRSLTPTTVESLGNGRFKARAKGEGRVQARAVSDTTLTATATLRTDFPEADLSVTKSSPVVQASVGDTVTFTVSVSNRGPDASARILVQDFPPSSLALLGSAAPVGTVSANPLTWELPGLAAGSTVAWTLRFTVTGGNEPLVYNAAEIMESETHDPVGENNRTAFGLGVARDADVGVVMSASSTSVLAGDTAGIRVRVSNAGPARARAVRVAVPVPAGLTRRLTTVGQGAFAPDSGVWSVGDLSAGATAELYHGVTVLPDAPSEITVGADYGRFAPASDPNPGNNQAQVVLRVAPKSLDLTVLKAFSRDTVVEADTLRWTVAVVNRGPAAARDIRLVDSLDATGFEAVAVTGSDRMRSSSPGSRLDTLAVDSLAAGDTARIEFRGVVRVGSAGRNLANRVRVGSVHRLLALTNTGDDSDSAWVAVRSNAADLQVRKQVSRDTAFAGDTVRYVVVLRNTGGLKARRVEVLDTFDATRFRSIAVSRRVNGMAGTVPGRLTTDSLAPRDSALIEITAVLDSSGVGTRVLNRAAITRSEGVRDSIPRNDTASAGVFVRPRLTDLVVLKTVSKDTAAVGDTLTYTVRVTNTGPSRVTGFGLLEAFDTLALANIRVLEQVRLRGTLPGDLAGDVLGSGESATLRFSAVVTARTEGTSVSNVAGLTSVAGARDTLDTNDADSVATFVSSRTTDLMVAKKVILKGTAYPGDSVNYEIGLVNRGPVKTGRVELQDSADYARLTGARVLARQRILGSFPAGLYVDSLAPGDTAWISYVMAVAPGTEGDTLDNVARIRTIVGARDTTAANNTASVRLVIGTRTSDLQVLKTVDRDTAMIEEAVTYEIRVVNLGPFMVPHLEIRDSLDATAFMGFEEVFSYKLSGSVPGILTADSLARNDTAVYRYVAYTSGMVAGTNVPNTARVAGLVGVTDPTPANDTATASLYIVAEADLNVVKYVDNPDPYEGDTLTYVVELQNFGMNTAKSVQVFDSLPAGLTRLSHTTSRGTFNTTTKVWTVDSLVLGQTDTLRVKVRVDSGTVAETLTNRAGVLALSGAVDANPTNDTASAPVLVHMKEAYLTLSKSVDAPMSFEGDHVAFTLTASNMGAFPALDLSIKDSLGVGFTVDSVKVDGGSWDGPTRTWTISSMGMGGVLTLTTFAKVDSGTVADTLWNRARILGFTGAKDTVPVDDTASAWVMVRQKDADLSVAKWPDHPDPFEGDTVVYTVQLTNHGSYTARNVQAFDSLPAGLTLLSHTTSRGTYLIGTKVWTLDSLPAFRTDTLKLKVRVDSGTVFDTLRNRAGVIGFTNAVDANRANDTVTSAVKVQQKQADLSILKWADKFDAYEGDTISYMIQIVNHGGNPAKAVRVFDSLAAGLTQISFTTTRGTFTPATRTWLLDSMLVGQVDTLKLKARVDSGTVADTLKNRAGVLGLVAAVDPNPSNDTSSFRTVVGQKQADLAVTKMVDKPFAYEGDTLRYVVRLMNLGSHAARNVQAFDSTRAGLTYVTHLTSRGTFSSSTRVWTLDSLGVGQMDSLVLKVRVDSGTVSDTLRNRAGVIGFTGAVETYALNDTATAWTMVGQKQADLALHKFQDKPMPFPGDTVTYVVELQNFGSHVARNVQVWDSADVGLTHLSATQTRGTFSAVSRVWTVDSVAPGQTDSLRIKVKVDSLTEGDTLRNRAKVFARTDVVETNPLNDTVSVRLAVEPRDLLEVTTWVTDPSPSEGQDFQFKVAVRNIASIQLGSVVVRDTVPVGITYIGYATARGSGYTSGSGTWTVGTLNPGVADTLTLNVEPAGGTLGTTIANRAWGTSSPVDQVTGNNSASVPITVGGADLYQVTKWVSKANPSEGEDFQYKVAIRNIGPGQINNVIVNDTLPAGITYLGYATARGSGYTSGSGTWTVGTLNLGQTDTLTLNVEPAGGTLGTTITNRAWGHATQTDTVQANNSASVPITVGGADLYQVTKWVSKANPSEGEDFQYKVAIRNIGPGQLSNIVLNDTVPAGLNYLNYTSARGTSYSSSTGSWFVGTLNLGQADTLTLNVEPAGGTLGTTITNRAWGHATQTDTVLANNSASVPITVGGADLYQVTKWVLNSSPSEGQDFQYKIAIRNIGPGQLNDIVVSDTLPAGLNYIGYSSARGTSYSLPTGSWYVGTLNIGQADTLTLTAEPAGGTLGTTITNRAWGHATQTDTVLANNSASVPITVGGADLYQVTKWVLNSSPSEGQDFQYKVAIRNIGPGQLNDVVVNDTVPTGLTYIGYATARGSGYSSASGSWYVGTLNMGQADTLTLTAEPAGGTLGSTITNRAWGHATQTDTVLANNSASVPITVGGADLYQVTKWVTNPNPSEGQDFQYKVAIRNVGPGQLNNVFVNDTLPAGTTYLGYSTARGSGYNSSTGSWSVGTLNVGVADTLTVTAEPAGGTLGSTLTNRAWGHATQTDTVLGNNSASVPMTVAGADMFSVTKFSNNTTPAEGQSFQYTVSFQNVGPSQLTGVVVYDTLPAGLEYITHTASPGGYNSSTKIWNVGTVNTGTTATLVLQVRPAAGTSGQTLVNRAHGSAQQSDTVKGNNMGSASITVATPDLSVGKIASVPNPMEGDPFSYLVWVKNVGAAKATGVAVFDTMPLGIALDSVKPTKGIYTAGTWTLDTVMVGDSIALRLWAHAMPGSAGVSRMNSAWLSAHTQPDPNHANDSMWAPVTPLARRADVSVTKSGSRSTMSVADTIVYTVQVTNHGPSTAKNILVTDTFPTVLDLYSVTQTRGTFADYAWTLDTLGVGASETMTVRMVGRPITPPGPILNTVRVKTTGPTLDTLLANDKDTLSVTFHKMDLQVTKVVSLTAPAEGQPFYYTVAVKNVGDLGATGVQVSDSMPPGLTLDSLYMSGGSWAGGVWTVGSLSGGDTDTIKFHVHANAGTAGASRWNKAWVSARNEADLNFANDTAKALVTPGSADFLQVTKTADLPTPAEGDTVTFTVTAKNIGPGAIESVTVADSMKSGFAYISGSASGGSWSPPIWNVGSLSPGASETLTLRFMVQSGTVGTMLLNRAWGDLAQTDNNPANDSASATVHVTGVDIALDKVANDSTLAFGDTVTYTVRALNRGPSGATNLVVHDALPAGLTPLSWTPTRGAFDTASGNWGIGPLAKDDTVRLTLKARVDSVTESAFNSVNVASMDQKETMPSDNLASVMVSLLPDTVDLGLTKWVNQSYANVGDTLTYLVSLNNSTPNGQAVHKVQVYDPLPEGLTLLSDSTAVGASYDGTYWTLPMVPESTTVKLKLVAAVGAGAAGATAANVAWISGSMNHFDGTLSNDTAVTNTWVDDSDVSVTLTLNKPTPVEGDSVVFTVTAQVPDSSLEADSTAISFPVPAGFTYIEHATSFGTYNSTTKMWTPGSLSVGSPATLQVLALVNAGAAGTPVNAVASLTFARPYDTYPSNNTSTVSVTPAAGDVQVTLSELYGRTSRPPGMADSVVYVIVVKNNTPGRATNVVVHDTVLAPLTFASYETTRGTFAVTGGVGVWTLDTIRGNAAPDSLRIRATYPSQAPGGYLTNHVRIMSMDQTDGNAGNNTSSNTISISAPTENEEQQAAQAAQQMAAAASGTAGPEATTALLLQRPWDPPKTVTGAPR